MRIIYKKKQIQEQERGERENQKKNKNRKTAFPQIHEKKFQNGRGKKTIILKQKIKLKTIF